MGVEVMADTRLQQLTALYERTLDSLRNTEEFKKFLTATVPYFRNNVYYKVTLYAQDPNAGRVETYNEWLSKHEQVARNSVSTLYLIDKRNHYSPYFYPNQLVSRGRNLPPPWSLVDPDAALSSLYTKYGVLGQDLPDQISALAESLLSRYNNSTIFKNHDFITSVFSYYTFKRLGYDELADEILERVSVPDGMSTSELEACLARASTMTQSVLEPVAYAMSEAMRNRDSVERSAANEVRNDAERSVESGSRDNTQELPGVSRSNGDPGRTRDNGRSSEAETNLGRSSGIQPTDSGRDSADQRVAGRHSDESELQGQPGRESGDASVRVSEEAHAGRTGRADRDGQGGVSPEQGGSGVRTGTDGRGSAPDRDNAESGRSGLDAVDEGTLRDVRHRESSVPVEETRAVPELSPDGVRGSGAGEAAGRSADAAELDQVRGAVGSPDDRAGSDVRAGENVDQAVSGESQGRDPAEGQPGVSGLDEYDANDGRGSGAVRGVDSSSGSSDTPAAGSGTADTADTPSADDVPAAGQDTTDNVVDDTMSATSEVAEQPNIADFTARPEGVETDLRSTSVWRAEILDEVWRQIQGESAFEPAKWPISFYNITVGNVNGGHPENFFIDVPRNYSVAENGPYDFDLHSTTQNALLHVTYTEQGVTVLSRDLDTNLQREESYTWQEAAESMGRVYDRLRGTERETGVGNDIPASALEVADNPAFSFTNTTPEVRAQVLNDLWQFVESQRGVSENYRAYWPLSFHDITIGNENRGRPENFLVDVSREYSDAEHGAFSFSFDDSTGAYLHVSYYQGGIVVLAPDQSGVMSESQRYTWREAAEGITAFRQAQREQAQERTTDTPVLGRDEGAGADTPLAGAEEQTAGRRSRLPQWYIQNGIDLNDVMLRLALRLPEDTRSYLGEAIARGSLRSPSRRNARFRNIFRTRGGTSPAFEYQPILLRNDDTGSEVMRVGDDSITLFPDTVLPTVIPYQKIYEYFRAYTEEQEYSFADSIDGEIYSDFIKALAAERGQIDIFGEQNSLDLGGEDSRADTPAAGSGEEQEQVRTADTPLSVSGAVEVATPSAAVDRNDPAPTEEEIAHTALDSRPVTDFIPLNIGTTVQIAGQQHTVTAIDLRYDEDQEIEVPYFSLRNEVTGEDLAPSTPGELHEQIKRDSANAAINSRMAHEFAINDPSPEFELKVALVFGEPSILTPSFKVRMSEAFDKNASNADIARLFIGAIESGELARSVESQSYRAELSSFGIRVNDGQYPWTDVAARMRWAWMTNQYGLRRSPEAQVIQPAPVWSGENALEGNAVSADTPAAGSGAAGASVGADTPSTTADEAERRQELLTSIAADEKHTTDLFAMLNRSDHAESYFGNAAELQATAERLKNNWNQLMRSVSDDEGIDGHTKARCDAVALWNEQIAENARIMQKPQRERTQVEAAQMYHNAEQFWGKWGAIRDYLAPLFKNVPNFDAEQIDSTTWSTIDREAIVRKAADLMLFGDADSHVASAVPLLQTEEQTAGLSARIAAGMSVEELAAALKEGLEIRGASFDFRNEGNYERVSVAYSAPAAHDSVTFSVTRRNNTHTFRDVEVSYAALAQRVLDAYNSREHGLGEPVQEQERTADTPGSVPDQGQDRGQEAAPDEPPVNEAGQEEPPPELGSYTPLTFETLRERLAENDWTAHFRIGNHEVRVEIKQNRPQIFVRAEGVHAETVIDARSYVHYIGNGGMEISERDPSFSQVFSKGLVEEISHIFDITLDVMRDRSRQQEEERVRVAEGRVAESAEAPTADTPSPSVTVETPAAAEQGQSQEQGVSNDPHETPSAEVMAEAPGYLPPTRADFLNGLIRQPGQEPFAEYRFSVGENQVLMRLGRQSPQVFIFARGETEPVIERFDAFTQDDSFNVHIMRGGRELSPYGVSMTDAFNGAVSNAVYEEVERVYHTAALPLNTRLVRDYYARPVLEEDGTEREPTQEERMRRFEDELLRESITDLGESYLEHRFDMFFTDHEYGGLLDHPDDFNDLVERFERGDSYASIADHYKKLFAGAHVDLPLNNELEALEVAVRFDENGITLTTPENGNVQTASWEAIARKLHGYYNAHFLNRDATSIGSQPLSIRERLVRDPLEQTQEHERTADTPSAGRSTRRSGQQRGSRGSRARGEEETSSASASGDAAATSQTTEPIIPEIVDEVPAAVANERNFRITDDDLGVGGAKTKYQRNVRAIRTLKQIEAENRMATAEEQNTLSQYVGWGSLPQAFTPNNENWTREYEELRELLTEDEYRAAAASTTNAHYTSPVVIREMWSAIERFGLKNGDRVLEPAMGVGNFFGCLPETMNGLKLSGVELDSITGRIAKQLYPGAKVRINGFEKEHYFENSFDAAVGNVPFGNYSLSDPSYDRYHFAIHDYFFAKTLDLVRPGGVVAFITSSFTMDKKDDTIRRYIAERAHLIGAVRLPNTAFRANAGTEVTTDILFLQKRANVLDFSHLAVDPETERDMDTEGRLEALPDWVKLGRTWNGIPLNSYFVAHPEMILGEMRRGVEYSLYGNEDATACVAPEGQNLGEALRDALSNLQAHIPEYDHSQNAPTLGDILIESDNPELNQLENFTFHDRGGKLYFRNGWTLEDCKFTQKEEARVRGLIKLRNITKDLIQSQLDGCTDEQLKEKQELLSSEYDKFVDLYGYIYERGNSLVFSRESSYYLLRSLENVNKEKKTVTKTEIFTQRTIQPLPSPTHADSAEEALYISLTEKAGVDLDYMSKLTGREAGDLAAELHTSGSLFPDPEKRRPDGTYEYVSANEYLTGEVRQKLVVAEAMAVEDPLFARNVEALKEAQPQRIPAADIEVRLGATWIDPEYIQKFAFETFKTPDSYYYRENIKVLYNKQFSKWEVTGKRQDGHRYETSTQWGTNAYNAYEILEACLNLKTLEVTTEDPTTGERVKDPVATAKVQEKQQALAEAFQMWIFRDPVRREALVDKYNLIYNSTRPREYDGSRLMFHGMNPAIELRTHQLNAVARVLYGGNALLAHEVGAGKTFEMIAAGMEAKFHGLSHKPLYVVPNHLIQQFANEFMKLYPNAKVLVATKKDFQAENRKVFASRIALGNFDGIIMGHSQFERINMSQEYRERFFLETIQAFRDQLEELDKSNFLDEKEEKFSRKEIERQIKSFEEKLNKLYSEKNKDDVISFEELGVDRLFVDEAHRYKNLFLATKMGRIPGISTSCSQRASDMYMKCQYIDELTDGKGIVFATGTPVSNSVTEIYTMMRYLQARTLKKMDLQNFDAWASTFGEAVTALELDQNNKSYRTKKRFSRFFNVPELLTIFKEVADIQTAETMNLQRPEVEFHNVAVEATWGQKNYVQELSNRVDMIRGGLVDAQVDNMLKVTTDGRKAALDLRLIDPSLYDDPDTKFNVAIRNMFKIWEETKEKKLTQAVFLDSGVPGSKSKGAEDQIDLYSDIRNKLVALGVPHEEIKFIHEAKDDQQKQALFDAVNAGDVRIIIGSTEKMGTGTNIQNRLYALHHLDCPWRPADIDQRNGRIIRQGNQNKNVHVYRYVTKGTFDAYLYQIIETKQKFISQIMTSKSPSRSIEDVDEMSLNYAEVKALCADNPLILEKAQLDMEVNSLKTSSRNYWASVYEMQDKLKEYPQLRQSVMEKAERQQKALDSMTPLDENGHAPIIINGTAFDKMSEAGEQVKLYLDQQKGEDKPFEFGEYRGIKLSLYHRKSAHTDYHEIQLQFPGKVYAIGVPLGDSPSGYFTRINNALKNVQKDLDANIEKFREYTREIEVMSEAVEKPFPKQEELDRKVARLNELNSLLQNPDTYNQSQEQDEPIPLDLEDRVNEIPVGDTPVPSADGQNQEREGTYDTPATVTEQEQGRTAESSTADTPGHEASTEEWNFDPLTWLIENKDTSAREHFGVEPILEHAKKTGDFSDFEKSIAVLARLGRNFADHDGTGRTFGQWVFQNEAVPANSKKYIIEAFTAQPHYKDSTEIKDGVKFTGRVIYIDEKNVLQEYANSTGIVRHDRSKCPDVKLNHEYAMVTTDNGNRLIVRDAPAQGQSLGSVLTAQKSQGKGICD